MNKHLIIPALIIFLTACSPTPAVVLTASTTADSNSPITIPSSTSSPQPQEVNPTTVIQPTPTVVSAKTPAPVLLQVLSPQDEAVVNTPQVDVIGSARAGAVVSVNEEILIVGDDGQFKTTVFLDEGPNLIEIIASDEDGNETSLLLTVTYEP